MSSDDAVGGGYGWTPPIEFKEIHPPLASDEALFEADRCLHCGGPGNLAPCVAACPADVDVPRFIREILDGDPEAAGRTIFQANVLGGSCARVCPVDTLCEGACVMHKEGRRPVEIGRLQRFATDRLLAAEKPKTASPVTDAKSVGVIGAGPAGLACAAELAKFGYAVTVYERRALPGGLVTYAIAPYKQVVEPMLEEVERVRAMGVDFCFDFEVGRDISIEDLRSRHAALFFGVGMGADTPAGIPGEDLPGVWESLPLIEKLKLQGMNDWDPTARVVVVGGGNTAIDVAREAVRLGAARVTMVYRRGEEQMPAFRHEIEAAKREGVQLELLAAPKQFVGEGAVSGLECVRMALGAPDASGRPRPEPVPGSEFIVEADIVIKAIGQRPHSDLLRKLGVDVDKGVVTVSDRYETSVPGIFAGGDCTNGGDTVVTAVRHGKIAALGIHFHLADKMPEPKVKTPLKVVKNGPVTKHLQGNYYVGTSTRLCKGCNLCVNSCPVDILSLDGKGKIAVNDIGKCVFCGMCEMRCPDFAIWVVKDDREHPVETEAKRRLRR